MDYTLPQRTELIIEECMKISGTNPYEIFHAIAQKDFVGIHGPEHHVLDGACPTCQNRRPQMLQA